VCVWCVCVWCVYVCVVCVCVCGVCVCGVCVWCVCVRGLGMENIKPVLLLFAVILRHVLHLDPHYKNKSPLGDTDREKRKKVFRLLVKD